MDGGSEVKQTAGPANPFAVGATGQSRGGANKAGVSENGGHGLEEHDVEWDLEPAEQPAVGDRRRDGEGIVAGVEIVLYPPTDRFEGVMEDSSNGDDVTEARSNVLLSSNK